MDESRRETGGPDPSGNSQVAIGFLRNSGTEPPRESIEIIGEEGDPMASQVDGGPYDTVENVE